MSTPPLSTPRLQHVPELDGIRGVAALMVLCHHLFFTSVPRPERWNWFVVLVSRISHAGAYGVDLFFVLSGFLITSLLLIDRDGSHFYWNFYWKRALRILPLYLVALLLLVLFSPAAWKYALLSLFFLANFAPVFHLASGGPFWTLAIEEQFYLVWPRLMRGFGAVQFSLGGMERLALALVLVSPLLRLVAAALGHHNYQFTFFHCDGLGFGALLACRQPGTASSSPQTGIRPMRTGSRPLRWPVATATALVALPFLVSLRFPAGSKPAMAAEALQLSGVSLLAYCMVAAAVRSTGSGWLAPLRSRLLTFFGLVSYCLYLANSYAVILYDHLRGPMQAGDMQQYGIRAAAVIAATLILCVLARYMIELPAMALRKHVLR